jgi:hypothetical protein
MMAGGRPPKPLEQRRRTGRSPGRDSGGRPLPDGATVTALPGVMQPDGSLQIPHAPAALCTAERAIVCPYRDRSGPEALECPVCLAETGRETWVRLWTAGKTWLSPATDLDIMLDLCRGYDEIAHHRHVLDVDGPYVKGQRGGLVAHPAPNEPKPLVPNIFDNSI